MFITLLGNITTKLIFSTLAQVLMILTYTSEPYIPPMKKKQENKEEITQNLEVWKSLAESLNSHKSHESLPKRETTKR